MNYRIWIGNTRMVFMMYDSIRDVVRKLRSRDDFVKSAIEIYKDVPQATFVASKKAGNKNFSWR